MSDAMRPGAITCTPDASLRTVAELMAAHHIHSVVVSKLHGGGASAWSFVSDIDMIHAAAKGNFDALTAADIAATETPTTSDDERLGRAVQFMSEHRVTHLVVLSASSGRPVGVLSTLDVAAVLAAVTAETTDV